MACCILTGTIEHDGVASCRRIAARHAVSSRQCHPVKQSTTIQRRTVRSLDGHRLSTHLCHQSPVALIAHTLVFPFEDIEALTACLVFHAPQVLRRRTAIICQEITLPACHNTRCRVLLFHVHNFRACARKIDVTTSITQLAYLELVEDSLTPHLQLAQRQAIAAVLCAHKSESLLRILIVVSRAHIVGLDAALCLQLLQHCHHIGKESCSLEVHIFLKPHLPLEGLVLILACEVIERLCREVHFASLRGITCSTGMSCLLCILCTACLLSFVCLSRAPSLAGIFGFCRNTLQAGHPGCTAARCARVLGLGVYLRFNHILTRFECCSKLFLKQ